MESDTIYKYMSLDLIFLIVMQNFVGVQSAILEKKTLEVAIFANFLDISELKLSQFGPEIRGARSDVE